MNLIKDLGYDEDSEEVRAARVAASIPTTDQVREKYAFQVLTTSDSSTREANRAEFNRWLSEYRESVIDEVEDHLVRRDQFTERTLTVIDELRGK